MIPLCEPDLTGKEREYVAEAVASGWVSGGGPFVERFEEMVAKACGRQWCVATITGTAALHVALRARGLRPEDRISMRAMTFIATANAAVYIGAWPRFVDIDDHWTPDFSLIGGEDGVADAAPAIGATAVAEGMACLSFNGNKTVTTGQGGAVVGDDLADERRIRHRVNVCKTGPYEYDAIGFNYRMPNLNAAMGCAQMERLPEFLGRKRAIMARYSDAGLDLVPSQWMAVAKLDNRDFALHALCEQGIDARPFWKPLHLQPPYRDCRRDPLPNTEAIWDKLVCLPCSSSLTRTDQDKVIKACAEFSR